MGKAPAFQFYAQDFDMDTADWDCDEIGIYMRLLMYQWANGTLPNDIERLARIARISRTKFEKKWNKIVRKKFAPVDENSLINLRMEEEREKQLNYRKSQSESGKKGVEVKRQKVRVALSNPPSDPSRVNKALQSSSSLNTNTKVGEAPNSYPQKDVDKSSQSEDSQPTQKNKLKAYTEKYCHREGMKDAIGLIKEIGEYRKKANPDDKWSYEFWGKLAKDDFTDFPKLVEWLTIIKSGKDPSGQIYKLKNKETLYKLWNSSLVSQNCSEKANIRQHEKVKFEQPNMSLIGDIMRQSQGVT